MPTDLNAAPPRASRYCTVWDHCSVCDHYKVWDRRFLHDLVRMPLLLVFLLNASAFADDASDYTQDVRPILKERCFSCHGALKQEAGLRLDTVAGMLTGGDTGAAISKADPGASHLIQRITSTEDGVQMPPEGKRLTDEQIQAIRSWIQSGAAAPAGEQPEQDPKQHWAFRRPVRPNLPVAGAEALHPIDMLIAPQREALGIAPFPVADKATLLRRLYLDLTGLPPSAVDVKNYLADEHPKAWDHLVDRLLQSPQYGERWGRHWMDVWRYSDWYGRRSVPDVMNSYPMIWRWRDWIVRSMNEDKPYDRMIVEMLAADELLPEDDQNIVATGYIVRSWFKWNYETWKKDLVEHTGKAFLGLTLNCSQCHDHKYDPIAQEEYFRFRAFFEPLELRHDRVPGEADPGPFKKYIYGQPYGPITTGMVRVFDEQLDAETYMFSKGDARLRIEGRPPVTPAAPAVLGGDTLQPVKIVLPLTTAYPGIKPARLAEERTARQSALTSAENELTQARAALASQPAAATEELKAAEESLLAAQAAAIRDLQAGTSETSASLLQGSQSLVLDAKTGRRSVSNALSGLDALPENGVVRYLVQVVADGHTNLQLALDIAQGATGGFVAFENGTIRTYQPGGFSEFVAGRYDLSKGQNRFQVSMQLDLAQNQFLLTVTSLTDNAELVSGVPGALNGWKPLPNGKRGLFIDCRPGTEAIYDDLAFFTPDGLSLLAFSFEPPEYADGDDVTKSGGWTNTGFSMAPATSIVTSAISGVPAVRQATERLRAARSALNAPLLAVRAAELKVAAVMAEQKSLEQRILADATRYSTGLLQEDRGSEPAVKELIHSACRMEREAALATAQAGVAAAEAAVAAAENKLAAARIPAEASAVAAATAELQAAQQQLTAAAGAVNAATADMAKELGEYASFSPRYPQVTTGRRAALAGWIASKDNPLTARVAANHVWLRHFGKAIVESTHDFGRNGSRPSHPELLDFLACELMDSGWSLKHLHRLIVTSQTYQLASAVPQTAISERALQSAAQAVDADNRTYWKFPASRMQAEVVRDSLLVVSEELDGTMGGHEIDHRQGLTSRRRSLYFAYHGEEKMEFLELFDAANPLDCYKRSTSVQPQQALALTNSELTRTLSRQLAKKLWARVSAEPVVSEPVVAESVSSVISERPTDLSGGINTPETQAFRYTELAFLQVLNRMPQDAELKASLEFLEQQASRLSPSASGTASETAASTVDPNERARENLIHALMNHNDFVTIR